MSIKNKFQNWFYLDEEDEDTEHPTRKQREEQRPIETTEKDKIHVHSNQLKNEQQQSNRVVSLQSVQKSSKVILIEPRVYAEAQDISEHLKNKRAVVVNLATN